MTDSSTPGKGLEVLWTWAPRVRVTPITPGEAVNPEVGLDVTALVQPLVLHGRMQLEPDLIRALRTGTPDYAWGVVQFEAESLRYDMTQEFHKQMLESNRFRDWSKTAVALALGQLSL